MLMVTAASIGFFHTLFGPDHYMPFIAMSKARGWSVFKTIWLTVLCGLGHVGSSVVLGLIGVSVGIACGKLEGIESFRANLAGWLLLSFGLVYFVWGLRKAFSKKPFVHQHLHGSNIWHSHEHLQKHEHPHTHEEVHSIKGKKDANIVPWVLFVIFILGPCEPLIPLLIYPAARSSMVGLILVVSVFSITTILTMLGVVLVSVFGVNFLPVKRFERYSHALAGFMLFLCGAAIQFLGL